MKENLKQNFFTAIEKGDLKQAQTYFKDLGDINCTNHYHESALNIAVRGKNKSIIQWLLEQDNIDLHNQGYLTGTPLAYAIFTGQIDIAMILLAKEDKYLNQEHPGAINLAILNNNQGILEQFKNKEADFNLPGIEGYEEPPEWVLKPESDPRTTPFNRDIKLYLSYTPIALTLYNNNIELLRYLVEQCHADPNKPNTNNKLPLEIAVEKNNKVMVEILLKAGANPELPKPDSTDKDLPHFLRKKPLRITPEIQKMLDEAKQEKMVRNDIHTISTSSSRPQFFKENVTIKTFDTNVSSIANTFSEDYEDKKDESKLVKDLEAEMVNMKIKLNQVIEENQLLRTFVETLYRQLKLDMPIQPVHKQIDQSNIDIGIEMQKNMAINKPYKL